MTSIAIGAAIGVACAIIAGIVVVLTRRAANRRVRELTDQLQGAPGPERAAELPPASVELASSLDPDNVIDRVLDQVVALRGIDAALISVQEDTGEEARTRTQAAGLSEDEIERTLLHLPAHPDLRAIEVRYRYRLEDVNESARLPRAALVVALRAEGEPIGSLAAITRSSVTSFPPETQDALEGIARRAGPALWNAIRYTQAKELAELDQLTGLHNQRLFWEFLAREIARTRRYDGSVSLIVFDLDDFKRINDRIGHHAGDMVLSTVGASIRSVIRETDIACRYGGDEFTVILPETSRDDAELLADRISTAIRTERIEKVGPLKISAGVAELRPDETAPELFRRADEALLRAKRNGKGRIEPG